MEILETRIAPSTLFGLTESNQLVRFDSATPGTVTVIPVTGLDASDELAGLDFRPETSQLYGISITAGSAANSVIKTYLIDPATGAATFVGQTAAALAGAGDVPTGFDFNPAVDRMRYVNTNDENARLNPNNGGLAGNDTDLTPAATTSIIGAAYDRNFSGANRTTLWVIDRNDSSLSILGGIDATPSPNGGVVTDQFPLGITLSPTADGGFDIENSTGIAYAALAASDDITRLYTINLTTGAATLVGIIGSGVSTICGLTVAPAQTIEIVGDRTATYVDQEGDRVTVKVTKGTLDSSNFTMAMKLNGGLELKVLNLSDAEFSQSNVTIGGRKVRGAGDGLAHVGWINATGVDLGKVRVGGDLTHVDAGDGDSAKPAIGSLNVYSMGVFNVSSFLSGDLVSSLNGSLGSLIVKRDVVGATINVAGNILKATIGGSLIGQSIANSGALVTTGNIGSVQIGGHLLGGDATGSGAVDAGGSLGRISVRGSVLGGDASFSGMIESTLDMGTVFIGGTLKGGIEDHTGIVHSTESIKSVTVKGSIISGELTNPADIDSGLVYAFGGTTNNIGSVKVGGNLVGGNGDFSGVYALGHLGSASIGGSLIGGTGDFSGAVDVSSAGKISIRGDAIGGAGRGSGSVLTFGSGGLGSVSIQGSLIGTDNALTGILSEGPIGSVKVTGDVRGLFAGGVRVSAQGNLGATSAIEAVAIKSIAINGSVTNALILAGYNTNGFPFNPDAQIRAVSVGKDWITSSLATGADAGGDGFFGNSDDVAMVDGDGDGIIASVAKIIIKGFVAGSSPLGDHFGFVAKEIGSLTIGGRKIALTPGPENDDLLAQNPLFILSSTQDVRVHEVAV